MIAEAVQTTTAAVNWLERIPLISIVALCQGLVLVELIRHRKLLEPYAIVWVLFTLFFFILGLAPNVLIWLSQVTGIYYLTLLILIGGFFLICVLLQYSIILSAHSKSVMDLSRACAIMKNRLDELEGKAQKPLSGDEDSADK